MAYTEEEIQRMKKKYKEMKDVLGFLIEMGEDTGSVSEKIRELERELRDSGNLE